MRIATRVEFAFGADLTAAAATWTWTDVSSYALGSISVRFGRSDEASTTQPAACELRLRNTDGRFTPRLPTSTYYPYVRRQTPVRVSLNPGGTGYVQRFQGYIDQFAPSWPTGKAAYAEVLVTASGSLRRLGQGNTPLKSPLRRVLETSGAFAYWPLEEGPSANNVVSVAGVAAQSLVRLSATGPAQFGGLTPVTGSTAMPNFIRGGALDLQVASTVSSAWTAEFAYFFGTGEPAPADYSIPSAMNVVKLYAANGDYWLFQLSPHNASFTGGRIALFRSDEPELFFDTLVDVPLGSYNPWDGQTHHVAITASQSGGSIAWQLYLDGVVYSSGTLASRTLQAINLARLNQNAFLASSSSYGLGHFAVTNSVINPASHASAAQGYTGESAGARITRLCGEEVVPVSVSSTTGTIRMGPQGTASFLSLLRECEAADSGILYDGESAGLTYLAGQDRYNLPVAVALDGTRSQIKLPYTPVEDDQRVRNDWTVSRPSGASSQYADATHIAANGRYDSSASANVQADGDLLDQASWRVHLGTVEEMRVPSLSLQLIDHSELWASWLAASLGERLTATSLFVQYPPGTLDTIIEGYVESWDQASWRVQPNLSPFAPWRIIVLATDTGDTGAFVGRGDTDDSALNAGITSTATSIAVKTNSGPLWTTTADDFPLDVNVGGEQIRVTAMAAVGPTFVAAGTAAHADNASVTPGLPAGAQTGDLLVVYAAIRSASGVVGTPSGYSALFAAGHVAAFYKLHTGTESAPVVSFTGGVAGDTTSAQVAALRGVTPTILFGPTAQANASAQNIAYPAMTYSGGPLVVLWFGWKQDDWTSVTNFETEIGEPSSTLGSDQGLVWNFSYQSLTTGLSGGSWVVTGGASAISESYVVALNAGVQTATVTRSVNGVVKAHLVNASVSLWAPPVLGL